MPSLTNPRHERFAQELAKGKSQADAYAEAGYAPSEPNASRLTRHDKVQARVAEIQERAAIRTEITLDTIIQQLAEDRAFARTLGNPSAAVAATMGLAKVTGHVTDKVKMDAVLRDEREMSDAELSHIAAAGSIGAASPSESTH
jgi:phage terminase small subunit